MEEIEKIKKTLCFVAGKLNSKKINWLLGGSGGLMVNGVEIIPRDLDILVDQENVEKLAREFQEKIDGIEVHVCELNMSEVRPEFVEFNGQRIPVNSLEEELEFYRKRKGKEKTVELIIKKLDSSKESESFEMAKTYLGKTVEVQIDRPVGSLHPKHGFVYKSNYGFIPGTKAPDGEELDAYFLGTEKPKQKAKGICVAVIHRTNDNDDKLVVVPEEKKDLSDKEIEEQTHFQEQFFEHKIVRFSSSQNLAN